MTIIAHNTSHLLPLDVPQNPLDLITTSENKYLAKKFSEYGMKSKKVREIFIKFYDPIIIIRELEKKSTYPKWKEHIEYMKTVHTQYGNAIKKLKKILSIKNLYNHGSVVVTSTMETVREDIAYLENKQVRFVSPIENLKPSIEPRADSFQQMLNIQSRVFYEYLRRFDREERHDKYIYAFIAELFRNFYKGYAFNGLENLTGKDIKIFVDNTKKLEKIKKIKLEKEIENIIS
jgi:hypothetical protein